MVGQGDLMGIFAFQGSTRAEHDKHLGWNEQE